MKLAIAGGVAATVVAACSVNVDNSKDAPPAPSATAPPAGTDAPSSPDAAADVQQPAAEKKTYVAICVTALASRDPAQALRFFVETDGAALTIRPLHGWENGTYYVPPIVSDSEFRGSPMTASIVGPSAIFPTVSIDASANSISGWTIAMTDMTLTGKLPPAGGCSSLSGQLTQPYAYTFKANENTCRFFPISLGDALPATQASDFNCTN